MLAEAPIGLVVAFLDVEHRIIVLDYLFSSPLTIVCAIVGVVAVGLLTCRIPDDHKDAYETGLAENRTSPS